MERKCPVGIQTFERIRKEGYLYIDKTSLIYDLVHESGSAYFLCRPRRFSKSLLLSTMQTYFEGRRELFDGLAMVKLETDWERHLVIRIDPSTVKTEDSRQLVKLLDFIPSGLEATWGRSQNATTPGSRLMALIKAAHAQTGKSVTRRQLQAL